MGSHRLSPKLKWAALLITTFLICIGIYWPGLQGPFIFDDLTNILLVKEIRLQELSWPALYEATFSRAGMIGRPISMLSFALNYYFTGYEVFYFKITNILIHFANASLLFWLVRILITQTNNPAIQSPRLTDRQILLIAASVSIIWLIHPLNLTSVLYVVQRMNSLATLFMFLGMILYVHGRVRVNEGQMRGIYIILTAVILYTLLAVLCKENGILLPAYLLLIEAIFFQFKSNINHPNIIRYPWILVIISTVVCLLVIAIFFPEMIVNFLDYRYRNFTLGERLLTESRAIWFYISLIFLPIGSRMGLFHDDFQISTGLLTPISTTFSILGLFLMLLLAIYRFKKNPILAFGILWFLLGHTIESTALPLELIHEHRNYLPQIGLLLIPIYFLLGPAKLIQKHVVRYAPVVLVVLVFSGITFVRASNWQDEWTLYNMMYLHHPNSVRTNSQLGILYHDNGAANQATFHFTRAVAHSTKNAVPVIQLAHHLLSSDVKIPDTLLDELDHRLQEYNFSYTTLWAFNGFLEYSARFPYTHKRLLTIYENALLNRPEQISPVYRAATFRTLAFGFRERKQFDKALHYFNKASEHGIAPVDLLSPAEIEIQRGNIRKSREYLNILASRKLVLSEEELQSISKLQSIIKRKIREQNSGK